MMMRVAIDARTLGSPKTGDRTYCLNLLRGMAAVRPEGEFLLYTERETGLPEELPPNFRQVVLKAPQRGLWTPWSLPRDLGRRGADLLHVQYIIPPSAPCPIITTIHDISFRRHPEWFPLKHRLLLNFLIPMAARNAAQVITGSEYSRADLIDAFDLPPEKVTVTPYAADPIYRPIDREAAKRAVSQRFGLRGPFVLAVGVLQPRKNLPRLIRAFGRIAKEVPHALALVGKPGWAHEELQQAATASGLGSRLKFTGYVPDADLPFLYNAADLFVYPSLLEGFGFCALEAMACGTPVITSNVTSLPEVVGDAALMVEPTDGDALAGAIRQALTDEPLRERLREAGFARAARFSWERTAAETLDVYRKVLEGRESEGTTLSGSPG
jgi:glycosyltransferase involved in cell wall biosynthesis